jgi:hypothetical protein
VRTTSEHNYKGRVEVWVDGAQTFEADVHLTKSQSVEEFETLVGIESVVLSTTWDGRFHGLAHEDLRNLQAVGEFELSLPGDRKGRVVVPNGRDPAYLLGLGDPPF